MRAVCDLCGSLIEFFNMITSSRSLFTEERSEENREEAAAPASLPESYSSVLVFSVFFLERTAIPVVARWIETKAAGAVTFHETRCIIVLFSSSTTNCVVRKSMNESIADAK